MMKLTTRNKWFITHFLDTGNASEAARRAGYKPEYANITGCKLLKHPKIIAALAVAGDERRRANDGRLVVPNTTSACVYVVRLEADVVKIGLSANVKQRLNALNKVLPYELEVLYIFDTLHCRRLEIYLHRMFAPKRIRGEWFRLTDDQVAAIPDLVDRFHP